MYGVLYSAVFFIFRTIQKYKIQRLFIPRCSWREPLSERVTRQIRAKPCTPAPKIGYGVLVCLRRKQPNTLRLTSRAFRGINRRCRYTFIAGQGKKKKPEPNTFSSIRFRLLLVHRKEYCRFPTFGCEPRQGAACGWHSSIRACGATQLDSA